jgi:adenylate cyclase
VIGSSVILSTAYFLGSGTNERAGSGGMTDTGIEVAVLLADVTGSTPLYEVVGDAAAALRVGRCLGWMREIVSATGGTFVSSKGDDVLATFAEPAAALAAAERIMAGMPMDGLSVHAGLHFGAVISTASDIFGDAVNLTARLASMANAGEVLVSGELVSRLPPARAATLRRLSAMRCKGKALPVEVYTPAEDTPMQTEVRLLPGKGKLGFGPTPGEGISIILAFDGNRHVVEDGCSISLGRAPENDVVVAKPWVSRQHATIAVAHGRVQLTDRSSYGSYVVDALGCEFVALRETVVLIGMGRISLGSSVATADAAIISYEIRAAVTPTALDEAKGA